jgi:hypothetical protein
MPHSHFARLSADASHRIRIVNPLRGISGRHQAFLCNRLRRQLPESSPGISMAKREWSELKRRLALTLEMAVELSHNLAQS